MPWAKRAVKRIPAISSPKYTYESNDYSKGYNSFVSNDKFPFKNGDANMWRLAQDARITTLGEYETRKGFDFHSDAAGQTLDQTLTTSTTLVDEPFNEVTRLAQKFTASVTGGLAKLEVNLKNANSATGVVLVALYTDKDGSPGQVMATSSVAPAEITTEYAYLPFYFVSAPILIADTSYWIVAHVQSVSTGSYAWQATQAVTSAKVSNDSGNSWNTSAFGLHFRQYYAPISSVRGLFRATKSDGTKVTLLAHNTSLYSVDNVTGLLTSIKTGLNDNATDYRFVIVNDVVRYVNGFDGYRKWDFITESQVNTTNYTDITVHKGLVFLVQKEDPNRFDYSNFADYDTFTNTDFVDVPAPKTGDPIRSITSLNGYLLIRTRNRCYILSGDDNATFRLDDAPDQKGTFSPNTSCADKSYVYFLSDDGVYQSNGTNAELISMNIFNDILSMTNKDTACIAVNKGRLYLWYAKAGSNVNNACYVWNLNYTIRGITTASYAIESHDTDAFVAHAVSSFRDDDQLLVASSIVGQVYWQELPSNDHNNLGGAINFMLQTHYMVGNSPSVKKEYRYWNPRFAVQDSNYTIDCDYATDKQDNWITYISAAVQGAGSIWGAPTTVWGAFTWGSTAGNPLSLHIPGEYYRIAIRYKHFATRQPHNFLGHTFVAQTRRLR